MNYFIYGKHAANSALNNKNRKILSVYCTKAFLENNLLEWSNANSHIKVNCVESHYLDNLSQNALHQDIVVKVEPISKYDIHEMVVAENTKVAILDQIEDPHNIGNIIRSAAAFNISAVIMPKDRSPNESGAIAKSSSGGIEKVNLFRVVNLASTIKYLKEIGFWIVGFDSKSTTVIEAHHLQNNVAIVLGNEGHGMRRLTKDHCDLCLKIPHNADNMESLNVSTTAGIVFYLSSIGN